MTSAIHDGYVAVYKSVLRMLIPKVGVRVGFSSKLNRDHLPIRTTLCLKNESVSTFAELGSKLILRDEIRMDEIVFGEPGGEFVRTDNRYR